MVDETVKKDRVSRFEWLWCLGFVALVAVVFTLVGNMLRPVHSSYGSTWESYLAEPKDSIDVLFLSTVAWVFFKAGSVQAASAVLGNMVKPALRDVGGLAAMGMGRKEFLVAGLGCLALLGVDIWSVYEAPEKRLATSPRPARWCVWLALLVVMVVFGSYGTGYDAQSFVYFQF